MALSEATKERIKSEVQFLNGIANSLFSSGVLAIVVASIFNENMSSNVRFLSVAFSFLCFFGTFALHIIAQRRLGALDE